MPGIAVTVVSGVSVVAAVARGKRLAAGGELTAREAAGCVAWCVAATIWALLVLTGRVDCGVALACAPSLACVAAVLGGHRLRDSLSSRPLAATLFRLAVLALAPLTSFFLIEWPYNQALFSIKQPIVLLNLQLIAAAVLALWLVCQRRHCCLTVFAAVCLGIGLANYFVCMFKGQTILPADVAAIGTAAAVAGGYEYRLDSAAACAVAVAFAFAAVVSACPAPVPARTKAGKAVVAVACLALGAWLGASLYNWYQATDIEKAYGVKVDVWATRDSYMEFGTVPSFLQRLQEISPDAPQGYATQDAAALQSKLARAWDGSERAEASRDAYDDEAPCVVAIMNETFSDLSAYPGVEGYDGIGRFWAIEGVESGWAYTSARGGGTCNSEFEYLTGSSLGMLGGGVYPYMFYDLSGVESLPAFFGSLGYATHAIHPAEPQNWRRDVVYSQLGFDEFISEGSFADAQRLRGLVTDGATYDVVLDILQDRSAPQFVFDVTIQNHGGYTTGLIDQGEYADATVRGESIEGMGEFLACIDASVDDLEVFLDEVSNMDRRVIVVFFGDHQPGFNDAIAEAAWGCSVGDLDLERVQARFATPYLIWANYDIDLGANVPADQVGAGEAAGARRATSLGYLMARTALVTGLPLTEYQKALLALQERMPVVNLNGYCGPDMTWYWIRQDGPVRDAYCDLETIQYANLFDDRGNEAFDEFRAR